MIILPKMFAYLKATRLIICLCAGLMALEGYWLSVHRFDLSGWPPVLAALAVGSGLAFANVMNDILDREADQVNHPRRPIASGKVKPLEAACLAGALLALSLLSAFFAGWRVFVLAFAVLALSVVYNLWAKKIPILGNFLVALSGALIFATGAFITSQGELPIFPMLAALLFILAREFLETVSDAPGDQLAGRHSIATRFGKVRVLQACLALALLTAVVLVAPALALENPQSRFLYLATLAFISVLPGLVLVTAVWRDPSLPNIESVTYKTRALLFSSLIVFLWLV